MDRNFSFFMGNYAKSFTVCRMFKQIETNRRNCIQNTREVEEHGLHKMCLYSDPVTYNLQDIFIIRNGIDLIHEGEVPMFETNRNIS